MQIVRLTIRGQIVRWFSKIGTIYDVNIHILKVGFEILVQSCQEKV